MFKPRQINGSIMLLTFEILQIIKEEIGYDDYKKIMPKVNMFRHLERRKQDRFIEQMSEFPTLKLYLLELQRHDEQQNQTEISS